ncbi:hypothetical protein [Mycolicibacterium sp. YH-1]|uniref:hypothetical protein n=1 Tax=Mycolicibacterium sp. YH-1 TaxID=2908837 RepID=UPI001F4C343C|nr:hypothetical protein [Mycolicibacterium sp. YH-1]UNB50134.1 hypothetical protein L0M16_19290 [Mycolicibacterium sp. YH-1]
MVFGIATVCLIALTVIQAVAIHQTYTVISWGSVSEGFAAVGTLLAVGVALWQSVVIRRQAAEQVEVQQGIARAERKRLDGEVLIGVYDAIRTYVEASGYLSGAVAAEQDGDDSAFPEIQTVIDNAEDSFQELLEKTERAMIVIGDQRVVNALSGIAAYCLAEDLPHHNLIEAARQGDVAKASEVAARAAELLKIMVASEKAFRGSVGATD